VDGGVQVNVGGDVVDTATIGTYIVTYDAVDAAGNHAAQVTRTVQVQDTLPPTIDCPEPQTFNAVDASGAVVNYLPPVASDITDSAPMLECVPAINSLFPLGDTIVSCTATDFSGNTSTCQFIVTVADTTPPIITLSGSSTITLEANVDPFTDPGASATDNVDGSVQVVTGGDAVNTASVGTYIVTYNAVDAAGNNATQITRTVQVQDTLPPVFAGTDNYADMENAQCGEYTDVILEVTLSDLTDSNPVVQTIFAYADGSTEIRSTLPAASEAFPIGTSSITLSATDASGNSTNASFTVTVLPRTTLNVTAGYIQAGHFTPSANMPIYIYELTTGNTADMVDGAADDSIPSDFYQTLYSTIVPDYTVNTNNDGKADIAVLFRNYFVVTGIDIDQSGTLDANDKYIGWQAYGLSCGDSKSISLITHPYAVFADHSTAIGYRTQINGDLAAKTSQTDSFVSGNTEITIDSRVTINGNILGDSVSIGYRSTVDGDVHYNELNKNNATISGNEYTPIQLPLAAPCPSFPTITPGTDSYIANVNQPVVLSPGAYDSITLNAGWNKNTFSTLQLEPGLYEISSLNLGSFSRLECLGPCEIRIKDKLSVGYLAYFGAQAGSQINEKDIKVYVEGINGADGMLQSSPPAVWIQSDTDVYANIIAPNGTIRGDYRSKVFGALIGKWVDLNTLVTASN
ncbi:HYR domain-containing protein, partial [bacterium]|nr:HYR domain-containing protein [bacterium]